MTSLTVAVQEIYETSGNPTLSVAVLHYNNPELTKQCVDSIFPQLPTGSEFFVVDNGSDIERRFRPLPFVYCHKDNAGNIGGQNRCFEHAKGEFVLFVSNDVLLANGAIANLYKTARFFPQLGQVQPILFKKKGGVDNAGMDYRWPGYGIGRRKMVSEVTEVQIVPSICYIMKKSIWNKMGGFDESLPYAYEDVDIGLRLNQAGYKNYVDATAGAIHLGNATLKDLPNVRERFHQARLQVIRKHFTGLDRACRLAAVQTLDRINNTWNNLRK